MADFILAIDQGTTGSTVALMDSAGKVRASVNNEFPQVYPKPGWVEHRPDEIWGSVLKGIRAVLRKKVCKAADIAAIGITNQRETSLLWDRQSGDPLNNAIVWQCRRTTDFCEKLKSAGHERDVRRRTGLVLDPYFSASKFRWLLNNTSGISRLRRAGRVAAGTVDSYLIWQLSGGKSHVTDVSNASRTSLMNLKTCAWDRKMLDLFEVPVDILPRIAPSSAELGRTQGVPGLPDGIPITGVAGDQQAALFGQACFAPGDAKCTFGTGSFILMNTGSEPLQSDAGLLTTVAWQLGEQGKPVFALEGGAFICGAAVQWLRDGLKIIKNAPAVEALAREVPDHGGVEFVPALTGLGAPHWAPEARGTLTGLTRGTQWGHIARATLDAMALQNADILRAMESDLGKRMKPLRVDGGAAANNLLMQTQADVLGRKLIRPQVIETTVAGACYLAGLGVGMWQSPKDIRDIWQVESEFSVAMSTGARRKRQVSWNKALERTLL
ncbi:glycerol kinase [Halioglobus japonicus]|uniref:glycerol kinase n=1 Tax=Halioglobus japonicus TaxID=930805 RepID=A0AAP8MF57_9GAMM|nr:glycerol kinase GlpK [Halioglobus japonicus]AQA18524.1 glycerol kinase [Halioglobus japonicus]PLW86544.1 glycerol kinase [Halioglobus japonicus]GHD12336.1 glycerol kinase 2 [Halioglobus japonicus]